MLHSPSLYCLFTFEQEVIVLTSRSILQISCFVLRNIFIALLKPSDSDSSICTLLLLRIFLLKLFGIIFRW